MSEEASRALVLGLDGVPWGLLAEWAEAGELPNVAALFEEGTVGPLDSTRPANTALAWPSIATGVSPDKHGVYGFRRPRADYTHQVNTSRDVRGPALWDLLAPAVVANLPMTYPATDMGEGAMVTGMMTPDRESAGFTDPPGLAEEIETEIDGYEIGLDWNQYHDRETAFMRDLSELLSARRGLFSKLVERDWRLFFFVFTEPDRLQHLLWEEDRLLEYYRDLDTVIGEARDRAEDAGANFYIVSDHGFGPVSKAINANGLLAHKGYLQPKGDSGVRSLLSEIGLDKSTVLGTLERVGITDEVLVEHLPDSIVKSAAGTIPGENARYDVDYEHTTAFVHGHGNVYVNDTERFEAGTVPPDERKALAAELKELFESLEDPDTGESVCVVHEGRERFPTDPEAPDLVLEANAGYKISLTVTPEVFADPGALAADHLPEGIFLAAGPDIEAGKRIEGASVFDVAPTVLHGAGASVPERVDGDVLDVFRPDSSPATREVTYTDSSHEDERSDGSEDFSSVEDRLQGLGYME